MGLRSSAKNTISVGAVNDIPGGYSNPGDVVVGGFSSWGPTDDGRIKPDVVANGIFLYSCDEDASNDKYISYTGTSMAAPTVTGSINLLIEYYYRINGFYPLSSTIKALIIETADEAGPNPGPDYMHGWGLMNTLSAVQIIQADSAFNDRILEGYLTDGEEDEYSFYSDGLSPIKITISWNDPPGTPPVESVDPTDLMLVNDLDMRIVSESDETTYTPYVLDPSNRTNAATNGDNYRDNVEQILIASPIAGNYRLKINHKGTLTTNQPYSIVSNNALVPIITHWLHSVAGHIYEPDGITQVPLGTNFKIMNLTTVDSIVDVTDFFMFGETGRYSEVLDASDGDDGLVYAWSDTSWGITYFTFNGDLEGVDVTLNYDLDADSVIDSEDNCPNDYNPDQTDIDNDTYGAVCECNDSDEDSYPGAPEVWYDGIDQNCDGLNDYDQDLDGYVDAGYPSEAGGSAPLTGDCDDTNADVNPSKTDVWYDGVDQNCDGLNDYDQDLDGYVDIAYPAQAGGTAPGTGDCNDTDPNINPGAVDIPDDEVDQDCNSVDAITCFVDADQDTYGSEIGTTTIAIDGVCDTPENESENNLDCDDTNSEIHPGAIDIPNDGIDQDCNGIDGSCCTNPTGDINNDGSFQADISDLLFLVDYMFVPGSDAPVCPEEADVNGDGGSQPDISDLLYLVDYMFVPGADAPADCQ